MTRFLQNERAVYLALVLYFTLGFLVRLFCGPGLELDEAEMVLRAQDLALGYGPQFPVYNWYQSLVFDLFGLSVASIAAAKFALLALAACLAVAGLRRLTGDRAAGAVAGLSLALLPDLMWEAQRSLTHSVAVIAATTALIWAYAAVLDRGRWRDYGVLGVVFGLACLSKANIYLMIVPAILVLLALRPARAGFRPLRIGRLALAAGIAACIEGLPLWWMVSHPAAATASGGKFYRGDESAVLAVLGGELGAVILCLLFWAAMAIFLRRRPKGLQSARLDMVIRALFGLWGLAALLILGAALGIGITRLSPRWLLPLSICFTIAVALWAYRRAPEVAGRAMGWTALALGLVVLAGLGVTRGLMPSRLNADAPELAARVGAMADRAQAEVITGDSWLLGMVGLRDQRVRDDALQTCPHHPLRLVTVERDFGDTVPSRAALPSDGVACQARLVSQQRFVLPSVARWAQEADGAPVRLSVWDYAPAVTQP
ncbi:glycosyltransferase family 39 protein [Thioclava sp. GXIMD4216]|uniref:glycosyltransferase family 39 protein n=1 Tax=Thioclava sp. GXIMD4216 TaxID=3131929 RepID=UPI0030D33FEE